MNPAPLVETTLTQDAFAEGAEVSDSAEVVWITFWANHGPERHSVVRIAMPVGAYHRMIRDMVGAPTFLDG